MRLGLVSLFVLFVPTIWATDFSVLTYGAKPDGITDDTSALVKASSAAASQGGRLYFPAGTYLIDPTKGHIALGNNMTIYGPGVIKVKPNVGNFDYIIGPTPSYAQIKNVTIQDITVDENVLNNPSTVIPQVNQVQNIIEAYSLDGLTVSGVTFDLSGVYAVYIKDHLTMTGNTVTFEKRSDNAWFDNSAIYLPTDHSTCSFTGNHFGASTDGANTAIELHNTENCSVSNNTFDNYATAVLPLDSYELTIANNTIARAQYAISMWSDTELQNISITNNTISLNNLDRQSNSAAGIAFYWCTKCSEVGSFYNITIAGNNITFQPENRTNVASYSYWGIGVQPAGNVDTVNITGNTITNAPIRGIKIGNALASNRETNILIENNTLVNSGNNKSSYGYEAAIAMDGNVQDVTVTGNTIKSTTTSFTGHYGVWSNNSAGTFAGINAAGNQIGTPYANVFASGVVH